VLFGNRIKNGNMSLDLGCTQSFHFRTAQNKQPTKMKKILLGITVMGLAVFTVQAAPTTQDNGTTAGVGAENANAVAAAKVKPNLSSAPTSIVLFSFGPLTNNPTIYSQYIANAVSSIIATGTLPTGDRTGPTDARLLTRLVPEDLMSATVPFHWDNFNPTGQWSSEMGGAIYSWTVSSSGPSETIALADVLVVTSSSGGNILGKTNVFTGSNVAYGSGAPGIPYDGSNPIISGPTSQQITGRVIVGIVSTSFPVNNTGDVQVVKNFIYKGKFSITNTVTAKGASATFVLSTQPASLTSSVVAGKFKVTATSSDDPKLYSLESSTNLTSGIWAPAGSIQAGQTIDFGPFIWPQFFVKYTP